MIPVSVEGTWWTEAHAVWIEAFALIGILVADLFLAFFTLQERREARRERRQVEIARQRSEVTLAGITALERTMSEEDGCNTLWHRDFKHAGFAVEKDLYTQLPEYLRRKCDALMDENRRPMHTRSCVFCWYSDSPIRISTPCWKMLTGSILGTRAQYGTTTEGQ